ncbi:hypothetical protein EBU24_04805 [bacterium]|nr:hypothetical protein [bacterium]
MAVNNAMVTGTRGIMEWYDDNSSTPYYSVWSGPKQMNFSWNDDDQDAGRQILEKNISAFEQNGVGTLLTLKLHPKKDKAGHITNVTPHYASIQFRPAELERAIYNPHHIAGVRENETSQLLKAMIENQNLILSKLSEKEFEEEEPIEKDTFSELLKNPQIQGLMIAGVSKFLGINEGGIGVANGIAGINDNQEEPILILNDLMSKGVTIEHLRKLNEMNSIKLASLLAML